MIEIAYYVLKVKRLKESIIHDSTQINWSRVFFFPLKKL